MSDNAEAREEAVPVVFDGKRYGYKDSVYVEHLYQAHHGNVYFFHPSNPPYEISTSQVSEEPLVMSKKQARSLRDQLNAMDLDSPKEN